MTKIELIRYIKRQLGHPVINIEIADEQIEDIINDTLDLFHEYHMDALKLKWKETSLIAGTQNYTMDSDVFSIVDIFGYKNQNLIGIEDDQGMLLKSAYVGNVGYFADQYSAPDIEVIRQQYQLFMSSIRRDYLFNYSYLEKQLKFLVDIQANETVNVLCNCFVDSEDYNYSSLWFRKYCVAMSGLAWSQNIGKYSGTTLPGNSSFNYNDIFNKYETLRIELNEQILERYSVPYGIEIG